MLYSVQNLNVTYEVTFKEPAFAVPQSAVPILDSFYKALAPRYGIRVSDLQITSGNLLSDMAVRVTLFRGNGSLEVSVEKFSGKFQGLKTEEDVMAVKDCLNLSGDALNKALPDFSERATAIGTTAWLTCDTEESEIKELLKNFGESGTNIPFEEFGATEINYSQKAAFSNTEESWSVAFGLERSAIPGSHVFFDCNANYLNGGRYNSLDERVEHVRRIWLGVLQNFRLEPQPSSA